MSKHAWECLRYPFFMEFDIMKVVIQTGGCPTRSSEETSLKTKPVEAISERPILCHIMKSYAHYGSNEFYTARGCL